MSVPEIAKYRFVVSEYSDGTPYISCQSIDADLKILGNGWLTFGLTPDDITFEQAEEIARFLNSNITHIQYNPPPFERVPFSKDEMGPIH